MSKVRIVLASLAVLAAQQVFANTSSNMSATSSDSRPCLAIAKACKAAGYSRKGDANNRFWGNCMKPLLLGQTVKGVSIDAATVKSCRTDKIQRMKQELKDLRQAG